MATTFDTFGDGPIIPENEPVATVSPTDLKKLSAMYDDVQARFPGQHSISGDLLKSACSPGADVRAVFFRVSMLRMLEMLSASGGLIWCWLHDGKPDDAVCKAVATVPMLGVGVGTPREGFPFDVEELIKLIKKESEGE